MRLFKILGNFHRRRKHRCANTRAGLAGNVQSVAVGIAQLRCTGLHLEALHRAFEAEVELRTLLGCKARRSAKGMTHVDDLCGFARAIADASVTVRCRAVQSIRHRPAPVNALVDAGIDAVDANQYAHEATHVARVAVCVPAAGVDNFQGFRKITVAVQQRVND